MLELKNVTKIYRTSGEEVHALRGIDLKFRNSEFVSVLGPSGCGKTTMLNIIGGLDHYTDGDLTINGKSTKEYKDRDWDAYRNHSVGFVFQTYNLIPHQTVLANVELALTLSGVKKKERRERAVRALERVGLADQIKKKPSELSGGQMQRVAIARAIVNDPDIVLADEPTGALDTETSIQIMEILKEISSDRLVVMVTHNPDLAEKYSTRIVKMLDGKITDDSAPIGENEAETIRKSDIEKTTEKNKTKKPSMSFATSFSLSLKNLFTKKGRTLLTSFAGSIGIIGIALIYAVSSGTNIFINSVQEETLSSYPITIEAETVNLSSLLTTFMGKAESIEKHDNDAIYQKAMLYELMNSLNSLEMTVNDLNSFKKYLDDEMKKDGSKLADSVSGIQYSYDTDLLIYTRSVDGKIIRSDSQALMTDLLTNYSGVNFAALAKFSSSSGMGSSSMMANRSSMNLWRELIPNKDGGAVNDVTKKQYDLLYGKWPEKFDEIVLFVDKNNELDDLTLYSLGLKSYDEVDAIMKSAMNGEEIKYESRKWSYEEICASEFRTILNSQCYALDEATGLYYDIRETEAGLNYLYSNALSLHVVGIVKPSESAVGGSNNASIGYTHGLTEYIIEKADNSPAVKAQLENPAKDIFSGLPFKDKSGSLTAKDKANYLRNYAAGLTVEEKAAVYVDIMSTPAKEDVESFVASQLDGVSREQIETVITSAMAEQTGMDPATIKGYVAEMSDEDIKRLYAGALEEQYKAQYAENVRKTLGNLSKDELAMALESILSVLSDDDLALLYDNILKFSDSSYDDNLLLLGKLDLESPKTISIFASSFENKDKIEEVIDGYNKSVDELKQIKYTDYIGIMISSITTIINAITYVLIAFVAVSLVVSSIMIGVITLISVQERTKEIGILRAIGASKKNVSGMFNAETLIIGFASGLIGVLITYLLCIPINLILHYLTKLSNLSAYLPPVTAVILIVISMLLTLIAGIIPSRSAAKKDPVVALRTE